MKDFNGLLRRGQVLNAVFCENDKFRGISGGLLSIKDSKKNYIALNLLQSTGAFSALHFIMIESVGTNRLCA